MRLCFEDTGAPGPVATDEALAEVIREELFAAGTLSRAVLQRRVTGRTGASNEHIRPVIERLGAIGDLTEGGGGILASSPVRLIDRGAARAYWLGTPPRRWLARHASSVCIVEGWPRSVHLDAEARAAAQRLGGVVLGVAEWAGVRDVTPSILWGAEVQSRLERAPQVNGSLVPAELSPSHYLPSARWSDGPPVGNAPALMRWTEFGYLRWGFAQGTRLVALSADEARRGMLALSAEAGNPAAFHRRAKPGLEELTTEAWLPAAEWRLLVGLASRVERIGRRVVAELPAEVAGELATALRRAGLREETET